MEKNFRPKIFEKPLFLAIFGQKFDKCSEPAELNSRRDACNSAKLPQYNPYEMGEKKVSKFYPQKIQKNDLLGPKMAKKT